jgi:hypothetical protein
VRLSRRQLLAGAGGALALPFLESMTPRHARAGTMPVRLVVIETGEGTLLSRWRPPTLAGDALELSELLQPLAPVRDRINVISGVANLLPRYHHSNGHNAPGHTLLTAHLCETSANADGTLIADDAARTDVAQGSLCVGPSIDHFIADRLGAGIPLNLAVNGPYPHENRMFYRVAPNVSSAPLGARAEARLIADPIEAFDELFVGAVSEPTTLRSRLRSQRRRVVDSSLEAYRAIAPRVSAADRARLEAHGDRLADLAARLGGSTASRCADPTRPDGYALPGRADLVFRAQIDVLVQALTCGVSRVASIQDTSYDSPSFTHLVAPLDPSLSALGALPLPGGALTDWHAQIHGDSGGTPSDNPNLIAGFTYYASQVSYLLQRMNEVVEPDGRTLLENSVVLWISEFGSGASHSTTNLPVVLAGSAGGRLVTGRHLERTGATTGDLYTSIARLLGVEIDSFGLAIDTDLQHGGIPGIA